jgi:hypothetical protein
MWLNAESDWLKVEQSHYWLIISKSLAMKHYLLTFYSWFLILSFSFYRFRLKNNCNGISILLAHFDWYNGEYKW